MELSTHRTFLLIENTCLLRRGMRASACSWSTASSPPSSQVVGFPHFQWLGHRELRAHCWGSSWVRGQPEDGMQNRELACEGKAWCWQPSCLLQGKFGHQHWVLHAALPRHSVPKPCLRKCAFHSLLKVHMYTPHES